MPLSAKCTPPPRRRVTAAVDCTSVPHPHPHPHPPSPPTDCFASGLSAPGHVVVYGCVHGRGHVSGFTALGSPRGCGGLVAPSPMQGSLRRPDRSAMVPPAKALQDRSTLAADTHPTSLAPHSEFSLRGGNWGGVGGPWNPKVQQFVSQKTAKSIFPLGNIIFCHYEIRIRGGGGALETQETLSC